jgi:glutamate/aspartate transport system substrate-binding protein
MTYSARALLSLLIAALAAPAPAPAADGDTLEQIRSRGAINLGHRESSLPFSYYDADGRVVGYSHDLALRVVEAIRGRLREPGLKVRLIPVTPQNRIGLVQRGAIDLECGSTTHNSDRARQVSFSNTVFIIGTRLLTRHDSGIRDFPDLAGRRVVTTAGTTSERLLRRMDQEKQLGLSIVTTRDHGESFGALEAGQADAFMMDDALLYGELAKAAEPDAWRVTGMPQSFEAYACMMRRGDPAFKRLVDDALADAMTSGDAERIYRKWFMSPLPPNGLNLRFPMSDAMKSLYRAPNDNPFQ